MGDASRGPMAAEHDASPPTGELTAQPHGSTRGQAQERAGEPYDAGRAAARAYGPGHEREIGGTWTDADSGLHGRPLADLGSEARVGGAGCRCDSGSGPGSLSRKPCVACSSCADVGSGGQRVQDLDTSRACTWLKAVAL